MLYTKSNSKQRPIISTIPLKCYGNFAIVLFIACNVLQCNRGHNRMIESPELIGIDKMFEPAFVSACYVDLIKISQKMQRNHKSSKQAKLPKGGNLYFTHNNHLPAPGACHETHYPVFFFAVVLSCFHVSRRRRGAYSDHGFRSRAG